MSELALETAGLPEHIQKLDEALSVLGDEVMALSELDGLLAAVSACPEPIPPEEWLPLIWTGEDVDEEDLLARPEVPEALALILVRQQEIAGQLAQGEGAFLPVYDTDEESGEVAHLPKEDAWNVIDRGANIRKDDCPAQEVA